MKSCENCMYGQLLPGKCMSSKRPDGVHCCEDNGNYKFWEPNFETLKKENVELKQQVETLQNEKLAYESLYYTTERHFAEDTVKYQKRIMGLEQALKRACKVVALNECPVESDCWSAHDCLCGDEVCIKRLMNHFQEAAQ
jgi:hypothetical protein